MNSEFIQQLKDSIDARIQRGMSGKEDKYLADMANMPGWDEVLKPLLNSILYGMFEPINPKLAKEIGSLEMIGAMGMARGLMADTLQSIVALVENTRASQKADEARQETEEAEKEEAAQG